MAAKIIPNNTSGGPNSRGTGSGVVQRRAPFGSVTVVGKAGDEARVDTNAIFPLFDTVNQGIYVQVTLGSVTIAPSLAPADLGLNPLQDGTTFAAAEPFAVADGIKKLSTPLATVLLVTFVADGTVHLAGA